MKRVCAWCNEELGTVDAGPDFQNAITHGMCRSCRDDLVSGKGRDLQRCIDKLEVPVVAVDSTGIMIAGNARVQGHLQKPLSQIREYLCGDVLACANTQLPGGCWNTANCPDCDIRRAVLFTYKTGERQHKIPALLNRLSSENQEPLMMLISTEKVADIILLRIDEMESIPAA